jgi:hypothetical protein
MDILMRLWGQGLKSENPGSGAKDKQEPPPEFSWLVLDRVFRTYYACLYAANARSGIQIIFVMHQKVQY